MLLDAQEVTSLKAHHWTFGGVVWYLYTFIACGACRLSQSACWTYCM